jgi:CheY-like chemotaxis protein
MKPALHHLLVIEDSDEDFEALSRVIAQVQPVSLNVHRCINGDDALDFLNQTGKYTAVDWAVPHQPHVNPDLIILDLNLPGTDGREILALIKQTKALKTIPIVVLSTSSNPKDIEVCYYSGVNSYMIKPMNIRDLKDSLRMMLDYWFKAVVLPTSLRL